MKKKGRRQKRANKIFKKKRLLAPPIFVSEGKEKTVEWEM